MRADTPLLVGLRDGREVWAWGPRCKHLQLLQDVLPSWSHKSSKRKQQSWGLPGFTP